MGFISRIFRRIFRSAATRKVNQVISKKMEQSGEQDEVKPAHEETKTEQVGSKPEGDRKQTQP